MYRLNRYFLCAVISILLFFAAAGLEGMFIARNYALSPSTYKKVLELNSVYEKTYYEIKKSFESEENATGIPATVYTDAVTPDAVREITDSEIDAAFRCITGETETIDYSEANNKTEVLKDSVDSFFDDYAKSVHYTKDDAYYQKTESVFNTASERITDTADVFQFKKIEKAGYIGLARKVSSLVTPAFFGFAAVTAVLLIILLIANLKNFPGFFYWSGISFGSVSLIALAACIFLKQSQYFNRFAIKASQIFSSITGACYYFTDKIILINGILFAVSVVFMIIFFITGKKKKEN